MDYKKVTEEATKEYEEAININKKLTNRNEFLNNINCVMEDNPKLSKKLGERVILMLESNSEISDSLRILEKICDDVNYKRGEWEREKVLENAYNGCVLKALKGKEPQPFLKTYVNEIEIYLNNNKYSDPAFFVDKAYNFAFKKD